MKTIGISGRLAMHHSLLGAGRTTHLKIAALSLAGAIVVVLIGLNARLADSASSHAKTSGVVVKAGVPATFAGHESSSLR
jgi:hypothetical protein